MRRISKISDNVLTLDQMVDLLEILPYDDPEGKHKETLHELNWMYIEERAEHSYAYQNNLEWDHGSLMKECEACDGYGETTDRSFGTCITCEGSGKIKLEWFEIQESEEYQKLRDEIEVELYRAWLSAVNNTAETAFGNLNMYVEQVEIRRTYEKRIWYERGYLITPILSWKNAAQSVASCISGEGYFWYETAKDLLDVGPYKSYKEAVTRHFHYVTAYPRVYGTTSISRVFDDNLDHYLRSW